MAGREFSDIVAPLVREYLNVLVVDDDEGILSMIVSHLRLCSILNVTGVSSVEAARREASVRLWHAWVVDLYVPQLEDGMALLEQYGCHVPVVVMSGRSTGGEGYRCSQRNVIDFLDKATVDMHDLTARVYDACLRKVLCPRFPSPSLNAGAREALDKLLLMSPGSVKEWADFVAVSPRSLEQRLGEFAGLTPFEAISLARLFRLAYVWCESRTGTFVVPRSDLPLVRRLAERPSVLKQLLAGRLERT